MALTIVQNTAVAVGTGVDSVGQSLGVAPTVGNVLVAIGACFNNPWNTPTNWQLLQQSDTTYTIPAIFMHTVASGDGVGPYTFTESGGVADTMYLKLFEIGGWGTAVPTLNLHNFHDQAPGSFTNTLSGLGSTSSNPEIVFAVNCLGGIDATASGTPWTSPFTSDQALFDNSYMTAYYISSTVTALNTITAQWATTQHSCALVVASIEAVPAAAPSNAGTWMGGS